MVTLLEMIKTSEGDFYLNTEIIRDENQVILFQGKYINEKLAEFDHELSRDAVIPMDQGFNRYSHGRNSEEKPMEVKYKEAIGSLLYLSTITRPDICYAVNYLSRYMDKYTKHHWVAAKRIFKYLKGTKNYGLRYSKNNNKELECFVDADYAGCQEKRKSTTGYVILFAGGVIDWKSSKQSMVTLSSAEAEYVALSTAVAKVCWLRNLLKEIGYKQETGTKIYEDNNACAIMAKGETNSGRTKHIDVKYHFVREKQAIGEIVIERVDTANQLADGFTKALGPVKFKKFRELLGLVEMDIQAKQRRSVEASE